MKNYCYWLWLFLKEVLAVMPNVCTGMCSKTHCSSSHCIKPGRTVAMLQLLQECSFGGKLM